MSVLAGDGRYWDIYVRVTGEFAGLKRHELQLSCKHLQNFARIILRQFTKFIAIGYARLHPFLINLIPSILNIG